MMKAGANQMDIVTIGKMAEEGAKVEEISKALGIEPEVVKNFMPKKAAGKKEDPLK